MNKPHKHAALIKAWADGKEIEYKDSEGYWCNIEKPTWDGETEYRIKPEKEYQKSSLTDDELLEIYEEYFDVESGIRAVADEAVKRYIKENEE